MGDGHNPRSENALGGIYFLIPFWGETYRNYFVDLCLPALLAPNNFPLLRASDGHRILMATTKADWDAIIDLPIVKRLREHVTPVLVEIELFYKSTPAGSSEAILQQNICQKQLLEIAFKDRVYASMLWPDVICCDGFIAALLRRAEEGYHLVLCASLRQVHEDVLAELHDRGYLPRDSRLSMTAGALVLSPRVVAGLAVKYLHSEISTFEEGHPAQSYLTPFRFWRVPERLGIIIHTFYGHAMLMNFGAIDRHDTHCLNESLFEELYLGRNFYQCGGVHMVQDSDELALLSLTQKTVGEKPAKPFQQPTPSGHPNFNQLRSFRESMDCYARRRNDRLKRDTFRLPVRWHSEDLDEAWTKQEERVGRTLSYALQDYYQAADETAGKDFPKFPSLKPRYFLADRGPYNGKKILRNQMNVLLSYFGVVFKALKGDREELTRIRKRISKIMQNPS